MPSLKGRDRCTLLMHTADAQQRGVKTGDGVEVVSPTGKLQGPVEVTDAIKPGVVSLPHGWGHGRPGTRMSVANGSPGVNTNGCLRRRSSTNRRETARSTAFP